MELVYDDKSHRDLIFQMYQDIFKDPEKFAEYYFDVIYPKNQVLMAWGRRLAAGNDPPESVPHEDLRQRI